jgi:hypothetical protein
VTKLNPFRWLTSRSRRPARRPLPRRLELEALETRLTPAVATPNQNFVSQVYLDLLHRQVDPAGLATWSGLLDNGLSRTQMVRDLELTTEYLTGLVNVVYNRLLSRMADMAGLQSSISFLQQGNEAEQLVVQVANSPEFLAKNGGTNDGFVTGLYAALLLGSPPGTVDASGRAAWDMAFANGTTRLQAANSMVESTQFNQVLVKLIYTTNLHRSVDAAGLSAWTPYVTQFGYLATVATIVGGPEYFSNAQQNAPTPIPMITSFTPSSGAVGTTVMVTGNFLSSPTAVTIAGTTVPSADYTVVSPTQLTITVPPGAATGSGPITVTTAFGTATSATNFTIGNAPTITSFTPSSGAVGTMVMVTGNFLSNPTAVTIAGTTVPSADYTVVSPTQLTITVPPGAMAGTGPITVTTAFGMATSATAFTIGPGITSFNPMSGGAGTPVVIMGTNLTGAIAVTIAGLTVGSFTVDSSTQITAMVPTGGTAGDSGPVTVTTTFGTATSTGFFTLA